MLQMEVKQHIFTWWRVWGGRNQMSFRPGSVSGNLSRQSARPFPRFPFCFRSVHVSKWNCCRQSDDQNLAAGSQHPVCRELGRRTGLVVETRTLTAIRKKTRGMEGDSWGR